MKDRILNKIQREIFDAYVMQGKVWAECPRQSGKTQVICVIAEMEAGIGSNIFIKAPNVMARRLVLDRLSKKALKQVVTDERDANVVLYDEVYYDRYKSHKSSCNPKIVCLRTKWHRTLIFTHKDLGKEAMKVAKRMKKVMAREEWELMFNGG